MKPSTQLHTSLLLATGAYALSNTLGVNHGVPKDSMISYQSIYFGYAPGYETAQDSPNGGSAITIPQLNTATGQKAATYNLYAQIYDSDLSSGSWADPRGQFDVQAIVDSGAVFIPSLMPEVSNWSSLTAEYSASIAKYFEDNYTSKNVTVWLRYAHEVNYYADPNGGQQVYHAGQDYDAYKQAWANMYNAVKDIDGLYLWWCPNQNSTKEPVEPWWPGPDQVDIVGMDVYPQSSDIGTFASNYGDFYQTYAAANNIPFAIGETGVFGSPSEDDFQTWLKEILNPADGSLSDYPLYMSATWYETGEPVVDINFYVVYDQSSAVVMETISNTENGS